MTTNDKFRGWEWISKIQIASLEESTPAVDRPQATSIN
jgi:hypothetical protein